MIGLPFNEIYIAVFFALVGAVVISYFFHSYLSVHGTRFKKLYSLIVFVIILIVIFRVIQFIF